MSEHVSIERMNEALDGLLTAQEMDGMEAHLHECSSCRNEHARLSEVVAAVRTLPRSASVPSDAWADVAARLETSTPSSGRGDAQVVALPVRRGGTDHRARAGGRRVTLSIAQLAAAAVLVAAVSAATMWFASDGRSSAGLVADSAPLAGAAARAVSVEQGRYGEVVDELERILEEGRSVLAPETLLTIEESLGTLDAAIADVEAALADDPNSDLLLRMLANHRRTRLGVLQRAAAAVQART